MYRLAVVASLFFASNLYALDSLDSLYKQASSTMDSELARKVRAQAIEQNNDKLTANSSYRLGYIFEQQKDYGRAIYAYFEAQLIYDKLGKQELSAQLDDNIGKVFFRLYNYQQALEHFQIACLKWKYLTSDNYYAQSQYNVGITYRYLNQLDSAIYYLNESLDYHRFVDDKPFIADIMNEMGIVQWELKNYELAKDYYIYLSDLATNLGDTLLLAKAYNNLGNAFKHSGDCNMARSYFEKAFDLKESILSPTVVSTINNLAKLTSESGNRRKAIEYYEIALKTSAESKHLTDTYRGLVENYKAINKPEIALSYAEKLDALNISVKEAQEEAQRDRLYFIGQLALQKMNGLEQQRRFKQAKISLWFVIGIVSTLLGAIGLYCYARISGRKFSLPYIRKS